MLPMLVIFYGNYHKNHLKTLILVLLREKNILSCNDINLGKRSNFIVEMGFSSLKIFPGYL